MGAIEKRQKLHAVEPEHCPCDCRLYPEAFRNRQLTDKLSQAEETDKEQDRENEQVVIHRLQESISGDSPGRIIHDEPRSI